MVHIHVAPCYPPSQPPDRHDGGHLRQDSGDQERVDEAMGQDGADDREVHPAERETPATEQVSAGQGNCWER